MRRYLGVLCLLAAACQPVKADGDGDGGVPDAAPTSCTRDDDCPAAARHCLDGVCVECESSADCTGGELCDEDTHVCRGCADHLECPASNVCDPVGATCVAPELVVYVDSANGVTEGDCGTKARPCLFLEEGLRRLSDSRSTLSLFGNFGAPLVLDRKITIVGYGRATFDFSGRGTDAGAGIQVKGGAEVVLDGLVLLGNPADDGIRCDGSRLVVKRSRISGHANNGIGANDCFIEIHDTELSDNQGMALYAFGAGAGTSTALLRSSLVKDNRRGGIHACAPGLDVRNNVFVGNTTDPNFAYDGAFESFCNDGGEPGVLAFNTFVGNRSNGLERGLIHCSGAANLVVESNIVFGNEVETGPTVTQCPGLGKNVSDQSLNVQSIVTTDPEFADRAAGDFRLLPGSPAQDLGDPAHALPVDFAGTPRSDGKPDIGAFEAP